MFWRVISFSRSGFAAMAGEVAMASSLEVVWVSEGRSGGEERKDFLRMPFGRCGGEMVLVGDIWAMVGIDRWTLLEVGCMRLARTLICCV